MTLNPNNLWRITMKALILISAPVSLACVLLLSVGSAQAGTALYTPQTVPLTIPTPAPYCYAANATTQPYATALTGFSSDGNYVEGQVQSHYTCGHSGRGGYVKTVYLCTTLTWDLTGSLVSTHTPYSPTSVSCPAVPVTLPSTSPPGSTVVGNEFTNSGDYVAETVISEACGSIACYATYYEPTLITP